jgi:hypothetical protein
MERALAGTAGAATEAQLGDLAAPAALPPPPAVVPSAAVGAAPVATPTAVADGAMAAPSTCLAVSGMVTVEVLMDPDEYVEVRPGAFAQTPFPANGGRDSPGGHCEQRAQGKSLRLNG